MSANHSTIRAVGYYRKSDEDDGVSVEQQQEWARTAAPKEGIELAREFVDQAKAGWDTSKRTGLHEMLAFCQEQKRQGRPIDALVCWHPNRFSRADSHETSWFIWEFRKAGVNRNLTASHGWRDFRRMEDRILFNIEQDASNHRYVVDLARDSTRGHMNAAREGRWNGGSPPYGYRVEYEEVTVKGKRRRRPRRLIKGPDAEVEAVRWIFTTYANTEISLRELAIQLTSRGVLPPTARGARGDTIRNGGNRPATAWALTTLKGLLKNPVYLGRMVWNRRSEGKFFGVVDCQVAPRKDARQLRNEEGEWMCVDGTHEALIDLETFEKCQLRLGQRRRVAWKNLKSFLLSGLLICGHCGYRMVGRTVTHRKHSPNLVYHRYICSAYNFFGKNVCYHNAVDSKALADCVVRKLQTDFLGLVKRDALREEIIAQDLEESAGDPDRGKRLRGQVDELTLLVQRATKRVLEEEDETLVPDYRKHLQDLKGQLKAAQDELKALELSEEAKPVEDLEAKADAALAILDRLAKSLKEGDEPALRDVLRECVDRIELWFSHEPYGKKTRNRFARGLIWVREDCLVPSTLPHGASAGAGSACRIPGASEAFWRCQSSRLSRKEMQRREKAGAPGPLFFRVCPGGARQRLARRWKRVRAKSGIYYDCDLEECKSKNQLPVCGWRASRRRLPGLPPRRPTAPPPITVPGRQAPAPPSWFICSAAHLTSTCGI
jgi:site-specific DNA recombinase